MKDRSCADRKFFFFVLAFILFFLFWILFLFLYTKFGLKYPHALYRFFQGMASHISMIVCISALSSATLSFLALRPFLTLHRARARSLFQFLLVFFLWVALALPWGNHYRFHTLFYENWMWYFLLWFHFQCFFIVLFAYLSAHAGPFLSSVGSASRSLWHLFTRETEDKRDTLLIATLAILTFLICLAINRWVFGGIPHVQDSIAQIFQAKIFSYGRITFPAPPYPEFFERLYIIIHDGKWYTIYPPGHALLMTLGIVLNLTQCINPLLSGLNLLLTYKLAKKIYSVSLARMSAILMLLSPFFILMGSQYMNHPTSLFFLLLFLNLILHPLQAKTNTYLLLRYGLSGFFFSWAFITRPFTAIAFLLAGSIWWLNHHWPFTLNRFAFIVVFLIGTIPLAVFYLYFNNAITGSPFITGYEQFFDNNPLGFGPKPWGANPLTNLQIPKQENYTPYYGLWNLNRQFVGLQFYLFGWPVSSLFFAFALFLPIFHRTRCDWMCVLTIACLCLVYYFYFYQDYCLGPRFLYESIPFLIFLTVRGLQEFVRWLRGNAQLMETQIRGLFVLLLTLLTAISILSVWTGQLIYMSEAYWGTNERIAHLLQEGVHEREALIFIENHEDYQAVFTYLDPTLRKGWVVALDLGDKENQKLIDLYPGWPVYMLNLVEAEKAGKFTTLLLDYANRVRSPL